MQLKPRADEAKYQQEHRHIQCTASTHVYVLFVRRICNSYGTNMHQHELL